MAWLVDGSNTLGAMHADLHADGPKRELARLLAAFARARRTGVTCFFDGPEPPSFGRHLGLATIVFSGKVKADELIAAQAASVRDAHVVTADRELAHRVQSRRVKVVTPADFIAQLREASRDPENVPQEDWLAYFSDPKNRGKF